MELDPSPANLSFPGMVPCTPNPARLGAGGSGEKEEGGGVMSRVEPGWRLQAQVTQVRAFCHSGANGPGPGHNSKLGNSSLYWMCISYFLLYTYVPTAMLLRSRGTRTRRGRAMQGVETS
jgi:hypothetical protein